MTQKASQTLTLPELSELNNLKSLNNLTKITKLTKITYSCCDDYLLYLATLRCLKLRYLNYLKNEKKKYLEKRKTKPKNENLQYQFIHINYIYTPIINLFTIHLQSLFTKFYLHNQLLIPINSKLFNYTYLPRKCSETTIYILYLQMKLQIKQLYNSNIRNLQISNKLYYQKNTGNIDTRKNTRNINTRRMKKPNKTITFTNYLQHTIKLNFTNIYKKNTRRTKYLHKDINLYNLKSIANCFFTKPINFKLILNQATPLIIIARKRINAKYVTPAREKTSQDRQEVKNNIKPGSLKRSKKVFTQIWCSNPAHELILRLIPPIYPSNLEGKQIITTSVHLILHNRYRETERSVIIKTESYTECRKIYFRIQLEHNILGTPYCPRIPSSLLCPPTSTSKTPQPTGSAAAPTTPRSPCSSSPSGYPSLCPQPIQTPPSNYPMQSPLPLVR